MKHHWSMRTALTASVLLLSACGGEDAGPPTNESPPPVIVASPISPPVLNTPAPSPSPTATPTPVPTPTPTKTPSILDDGKIVVVLEGDSITSPKDPGTYSGYFRAMHPQYEVHITAVGGSGLNDVAKRAQADMDLKPDVLTLFIGANDFSGDPQVYANRVFAYAKPFRDMGTKVIVGTVLPYHLANISTIDPQRNNLRRQYAQIMRNAVGEQIDGVFDFANHPVMGDDAAPFDTNLYADGLHPAWRKPGMKRGHEYLYEMFAPVVQGEIAKLKPS